MTTIGEILAQARAYHGAGQMRPAEQLYRQALQADPANVEALWLLATACHALGHADEAVAALEQVVRLAPRHAEAYNMLGALLQFQRRFDEATACYQRALELKPDFAGACCNFGTLLESQGSLDRAASEFERALALEPGNVTAHYGLGVVLARLGKLDGAIFSLQEACRLKPDSAEMSRTLRHAMATKEYRSGNALAEEERMAEALACYRRALELEPDASGLAANSADRVYGNMACALQQLGRGEEAIAAHRKAVELRPDNAGMHSNLLYALNYVSRYDSASIFAEHLHWAQRHAEPLTAQAVRHTNDRTHDRRLRVGYVSPYFSQQAVSFFAEPMIASHDHEQFEVFCYSGVRNPDAVTERFKAVADHWHDTCEQSDEQFAAMVRDDRIDILVDLTGHIGRNRLLVFARKPAPVQVTYLGYQNTTGMTAMDYRLTDAQSDPPGMTEAFHSERLVRLPRAFFCYRPFDDTSMAPLPARTNGHVTFGSFNNFNKVTSEALAAWLQLLTRVPRSRLLLLANRGADLEPRIHALAEAQGIDPNRIELCDRRPRADYLRLQQRADIALDAFPFNGHTTTCDSIWMGVPVVMLRGNAYASRFGGSVLTNVGLEGLIADSVAQYIDLAVALSGDLDRLTQLRATLRSCMADSALFDHQGFTRNLERAYREMWHTWCNEGD